MDALRIPTVTLPAEIMLADGREYPGRIFVPAAAARHSGPTRASEWLNQPAEFFAFFPNDSAEPVMFNKAEVLAMSVPAEANAELDGALGPERQVALECAGKRFEGRIVIDSPSGHTRVLDYLNRPERFLTLRDGGRHHLVRKAGITRVFEKDS